MLTGAWRATTERDRRMTAAEIGGTVPIEAGVQASVGFASKTGPRKDNQDFAVP